ncbi:MAG: 2-phospho-L-lactate transferase [Betaproteobacteria bacterium]|nr:2-phospho-L-lactate transferase [Betaproteobacteria bacterium]
MILALAGGVGGAKLASGLARVLPPEALTLVVNTGDDFEHLGLHISPDLDTVMYNLAGLHSRETGWGVAGETWHFMAALEQLGGDTWFKLGDRDLAVHVERTRRLRAGETLSAVTASLARRFGIAPRLAPMSDDPVRTIVHTNKGELEFQDYFVRLRCEPVVRRLEYRGAAQAAPSRVLREALADPRLRAVVICPSNPYLSIAPVLSLPTVRASLGALDVPVIVVSPIIGGRALKGPAAKLMRELGHTPSALTVAEFYRDIMDTLVIDTEDESLVAMLADVGLSCQVTSTIMRNDADQEGLARQLLNRIGA